MSIEVDQNNRIIDPEDRINPQERVGEDRRFIRTYYIQGNRDNNYEDKVLLVSKDEYENKYVQIIEEPKLQYYITKPEYWDGQNVNYIPIDHVDQYNTIFKDRYLEIPKAIGDQGLSREVNRLMGEGGQSVRAAKELVDLDGRVHGSDINIEDQYIKLFLDKYPADNNKTETLRKGFYDIEVDGTQIEGFPDPERAEAPINMISYIDSHDLTVYSYILKYDTDTYREFIENQETVIQEMFDLFKEKANIELKFDITECDTELEVISRFLKNINQETTPDFLVAWNADFDFPTIYNRIKHNRQNPHILFSPEEFPYKDAYYRLDTNANGPDTRSSTFMTSSYTVWMDQLALYATINKGQKTLESYSLDYVAKEELGWGKADFDGDIVDGFLVNYSKFFKYNVQDTVLQLLIEDRTAQLDLLYYMSILTATRPTHVMKKTVSLRNLGAIFYSDSGYIMSNNRSRLFDAPEGKIIGGFVASPNDIDFIGKELSSGISRYIHDDVTDIDLASLYPSTTEAINISPETHRGKITWLDSEGNDKTAHFIDSYNSNDPINFGQEFIGLPSVEDFVHILEEAGGAQ